MATIRTSCNHLMLIWARNEVGLTVEQASEILNISIASLKAAEADERPLTLVQLQKAAKEYDFPLGYFYFSNPPKEKSFEPVPDYRIAPELIGQELPKLQTEIRKVRNRRELYMDLASELGIEVPRFQYYSDARQIDPIRVRDRLGISTLALRSMPINQVYGYWKSKIEDDGVLVYESQYIPKASGVIGAAIFYPELPIILVKRGGGDKERKLFTLLHEYAHLLMGQSAINDKQSTLIEDGRNRESSLESVCNEVASQILVPQELVDVDEYRRMEPQEMMAKLSEHFKVTYSTAAVCLKKLQLISSSSLQKLLQIRQQKHDEEQSAAGRKEIKIPREVISQLDLGKPMFNVVLRAYSEGILDVFDASKLLSLRVNKIDKLVPSAR
ncbi:MAG: XRE family transcriptional regulator [Pseudohongiellaceae bacterium]